MVYQPRNVQPQGTSIDVAKDNTFSLEVQTNSYVSAYQLFINDFDNNEIYSDAKTSLGKPLYNGDTLSIPVDTSIEHLKNGSDYKWKVRLYQTDVDMLITYGFVQKSYSSSQVYLQRNINIKDGMVLVINNESITIVSYDILTGEAELADSFSFTPSEGTQYQIYSDFIETVPDYVFYARETPIISILDVPESLTLKYYTFQGSYVQSDNVPIIYHQFNLYVKNDDGSTTLLDTSGRVYSANLSYTYDGFRSGSTYYIEMITENDMGIISKTELYSFTVSYDVVEYLQQPSATFDSSQNAIDVSWTAPTENIGTSDGTINYLYNVPYSGVNSLYTKTYDVKWVNDDGLCGLPDDFNLTLQFSPDGNFFYDDNGTYQERVVLVDTLTDSSDDSGKFQIIIDKNKLIFTQEPSLSLEGYFYTNRVQTFVLTTTGVAQANSDYIWDDDATWSDDYIWTEGGTSLEQVCNHWWKVQITKNTITIEEIFPA